MAPSPCTRAPRSPFRQTWDHNDAAFLDPNALPVARIPRGWERKQEIKRTEEGREKKIWRRFNLRSRTANNSEEDHEEEHDARSRVVKKQQHMSPKAMEKTSSRLSGQKRAFKATRWDRRKSVLPRKKVTGADDPVELAQDASDSDDALDATGENIREEPPVMVVPAANQDIEHESDMLRRSEDKRATFTFDLKPATTKDLPGFDDLTESVDDYSPAHDDATLSEDATIARFFRSPAKEPSYYMFGSPQKVAYPDLPHDDNRSFAFEIPAEFANVETVNDDLLESTRERAVIVAGERMTTESELGPEQSDLSEADDVELATNTHVVSSFNSSLVAPEIAKAESLLVSENIRYPSLTFETPLDDHVEEHIHMPPPEGAALTSDPQNESIPESTLLTDAGQVDRCAITTEDHSIMESSTDTADEEFTEASLQLSIQHDLEETLLKDGHVLEATSQVDTEGPMEINCHDAEKGLVSSEPDQAASELPHIHDAVAGPPLVKERIEDITDGLTLSFSIAKPPSAEPTPRKLHSPPPPPRTGQDDVTMTIALDDDTALLKDFLNRAAASKAEKAAVTTHRRESLQNRRDSDVVRHALASPRKVLEDKDPNSPSKYDNELTLDLSQTLTLNTDVNALASPTPNQTDDENLIEGNSLRGSRRSSRAKKSRLPAPASAALASKIAIRRADGTEHVVLKKSDAQELATITRANTRKNKQGAFGVTVRLLKLAVDAANLPPLNDSTKELIMGKNIRWDEQLAYYQENPDTVADAESLALPDELSMDDASSTASTKPKAKVSKNSTPKIRRVRGLGTANGTPGKALLAPASLLPEAVQDERDATCIPAPAAQQLPRPSKSKVKKMPVASTTAPASTPSDSKLPSLDIAPIGVQPDKARKSRLAAPKKVILPQPSASLAPEGKENAQRPGIGGATPKKGIPAPKVVIPPAVGVESGLPRRRARRI